jgi:2-polyprenyl-6-methoxyphenol hydroxylase-like FAD-dependent oxidoreductase
MVLGDRADSADRATVAYADRETMLEPADVLVVGAGPTGLVLALWLRRVGGRVRIVDRLAEPSTTSRAVAVQARTLELYRQMGLGDALVARGRRIGAANLWVRGRHVAHAPVGDMGQGISPYPFALIFPQDEHERLLIDRLAAAGVRVERGVELLGFDQDGDRVTARLQRADGATEECRAAWIVGCDGAHSAVRETLAIGFAGGTYEHLFYVADADATGAVVNGEIHVALDRADFLALFPLKQDGRVRLIGTIRADGGARHDHLSWDDVSTRVIEWMQIDVARVNWFSTYHVHHRVAERFRVGRAFLAGDAAHIHSPVGGQGMNSGIGDAINLSWKLAAVIAGRAHPDILDTYESERIAFAQRLVETTDRAFTAVTSSSAIARFVRLHMVPALVPLAFASRAARRFMFRTVSQTAISYRGSALSEGRTGAIRGGDRLPWAPPAAPDAPDNYAPLDAFDWQAHVYGEAEADLADLCETWGLPLHVFPWRKAMAANGLVRNALYLIRPDGYVALAAAAGHAAALRSYLAHHEVLRQPQR